MFSVVCDNRIHTLDARNTFYSRLMSHLEAGYAKLPQSLALSHLSHGNFCINSKYSWFKPFKMNSVIVLVIIKRTLSWCFENESKGSAADVFDLGDDSDYLDVFKGGKKKKQVKSKTWSWGRADQQTEERMAKGRFAPPKYNFLSLTEEWSII